MNRKALHNSEVILEETVPAVDPDDVRTAWQIGREVQARYPGKNIATGAELMKQATSDGKTLYVLGQLNEGKDWALVEWTEDLSSLTTHDLRKLLNSTAAEAEDRARMDVSPDGSRLAFVVGTHVWILEASNLSVLHSLDLPWPAEKAAFSVMEQTCLPSGHTEAGRKLTNLSSCACP
jgi:hypothetical protein